MLHPNMWKMSAPTVDFYINFLFIDGSVGKESACSPGDTGYMGSIPGSGRSPGGGHGRPLQYSCLENPMDRGAWQATVRGVTKSRARLRTEDMYSKCNVL